MRKSIQLSALSLGLATLPVSANGDYLNFIIQIQSDAANTTHKLDDIDPQGSRSALDGVVGSSLFQLWSIHRESGREYILDEKTVSSYHPQASIKIVSLDPYKRVPRTRVDHPFTVEYTVSGIITDDPDVQDAAKSVVLNHDVYSYQTDIYTSEGAIKKQLVHKKVSNNGEFSFENFPNVEAAGVDGKARGHERISIFANPDFGVVGASLLAKVDVMVWPLASGSISGFQSDKEYVKVPPIRIELADLYPSSTTYLRIYKGAPSATPASPKKINTSYVMIEDAEPQNRTFSLSDLGSHITEKGSYTLELIHETPFGADILAQNYPLKVKRNIDVKGSISSSE